MFVFQALDLGLVRYVLLCYTFLTLALLIITVSCVIVTIKVKSNPPPQHFCVVASERELSVTLSIVTVVSILPILPQTIWRIIKQYIFKQMSFAAFVHITDTLELLYYVNSIVNPLIYAIRMQEFRKAVKQLCKRTAATSGVQPTELHVM